MQPVTVERTWRLTDGKESNVAFGPVTVHQLFSDSFVTHKDWFRNQRRTVYHLRATVTDNGDFNVIDWDLFYDELLVGWWEEVNAEECEA